MERRQDDEENTFEDMIAMLTHEAARFFRDEKDANTVVAFILSDLLFNSGTASRYWH